MNLFICAIIIVDIVCGYLAYSLFTYLLDCVNVHTTRIVYAIREKDINWEIDYLKSSIAFGILVIGILTHFLLMKFI